MPEFWVSSDVMPDGSYAVSVTVNKDIAFALDDAAARDYAATCFTEATAADHAGAVVRLMTQQMRMSTKAAQDFVRLYLGEYRETHVQLQFRAAVGRRKPPHPDAGSFIPAVLVFSGSESLGWIDPDELRDHAGGVLSALAASRFDEQLRQTLTDPDGVDLDDAAARKVVSSLAQFMPSRGEQS